MWKRNSYRLCLFCWIIIKTDIWSDLCSTSCETFILAEALGYPKEYWIINNQNSQLISSMIYWYITTLFLIEVVENVFQDTLCFCSFFFYGIRLLKLMKKFEFFNTAIQNSLLPKKIAMKNDQKFRLVLIFRKEKIAISWSWKFHKILNLLYYLL